MGTAFVGAESTVLLPFLGPQLWFSGTGFTQYFFELKTSTKESQRSLRFLTPKQSRTNKI